MDKNGVLWGKSKFGKISWILEMMAHHLSRCDTVGCQVLYPGETGGHKPLGKTP